MNLETLEKLAAGIIPADARDGGALGVNAGARIADRMFNGVNAAVYREGLEVAGRLAAPRRVEELSEREVFGLLEKLQVEAPAFFKQLRMDVCALYLSDPGVWQRIGFPGPSVMSGGYADFDQWQMSRVTELKEKFFMTTNAVLLSVESFLKGKRAMLIGSEWREASDGKRIESVDPATGEVVGSFPAGTAEDADLAVRAARKAFQGAWRKITPYERGRLLQKAAALMEKHGEELAQLITIENGKPLWEAKKEVGTAASWTEYYAGWTTKLTGETIPVSLPGQFLNYTLREPLGVVAGITPPNYPLTMPLYKAAPALATGNTIVIKPSEDASMVALRLGEIFLEAGLPEGVFNVVTGYGEAVGAALANHDDVDKITFTGSTEVGRMLVRASAGNLKKVSLELGGKSPNIVFADADLEAALKGVFMGIFFCQGEICSAGSRLFVEEAIYDEFVGKLAVMAKAVKLGHGLDPDTKMGPLVSKSQQERVLDYVRLGKEGKAVGSPGTELEFAL